ncbi:Fas-binding factor 1 [Holothuria leucospilota]|uniref:Fas-binding factor 1 n=1 Tax=Holothuria leucospilota TaxID=206669 RepID=A0A9Q1H6A4_HOLLE|nr:Fas-binding factor 1 [Holothuria leucospilota]
MDDMDDALFASSLRSRKSSTLKSDKSVEAAKNSGNDRELAGTRTLSPPSLVNTADSKRRTFTIKEEGKASEKSQVAGKKPLTKSFDFGEFDEDDPLAGLLSDEDEEPAPKQKGLQRTARPQPKVDVNKPVEDADVDSPRKSSPSMKRSTSLNKGGAGEKEIEVEQSITRAKSAPPPKRSETPKRSDDIDFGDDDILDTMGFDDSPPQTKNAPEKKKEDDEILVAKSKVADLFGKKPAISPPDKPPVGRTKEFVLDAKYRKQERGNPQKELDEEDFSFGSYTPSAVNTLKRPDSAPPGRRSVRFADDVDDLFGGTSTLGRPGAGGGGRQRSNSQVVGPSDGNKSTGQGDDEGDWLSLAIGKSNERKAAEKKETLGVTGNKEETVGQETEQKNETKNTVTDQRKKGILREEKTKGPKEAENPRAASAGDYLGLGEDIDLDTLLSLVLFSSSLRGGGVEL